MSTTPPDPGKGLPPRFTMRWWRRVVGEWGLWLAAISAALLTFGVLRTRLEKALPDALQPYSFGVLCVLAFLPLGVTTLIKAGDYVWRRTYPGPGKGAPEYFILRAYDESDEAAFKRDDKIQERIVAWLLNALGPNNREPLLYLTGMSGVGKSSLLRAYVKPQLAKQAPAVRVVIVDSSVTQPMQALNEKLRKPGEVFQNPHDLPAAMPDLLQSACRYLRQHMKGARLVVILDQFEAFLASAPEEEKQEMVALLQSLYATPIEGLSVVLAFRDVYMPHLFEFLGKARTPLPGLSSNKTWMFVGSFSREDARAFLQRSGLEFQGNLVGDLLAEMERLEGTPGLIRPIILNMVGLSLTSLAVGDRTRVATGGEVGGVMHGYVRRCLAGPTVRDDARKILRRMMLPETDFRIPMSVQQLAKETERRVETVRACLTTLWKDGLVRPLDKEQTSWQISHDFVARLLAQVITGWRTTFWEATVRFLPWGVLGAVLLTTTLVSLPHRPWYEQIPEQLLHDPDRAAEHILRTVHEPNKEDAVRYFAQKGVDLNAKGKEGKTALALAISRDDVPLVTALLRHGAKIEPGECCLHLCAGNSTADAAQVLLERDASLLDSLNRLRQTPLHVAAREGNVELVKLLLRKEASVSALDDYEFTPLLRAIEGDHAEVVELLIEEAHRARRTEFDHFPDRRTFVVSVSPLTWAVLGGHLNTARSVLKRMDGQQRARMINEAEVQGGGLLHFVISRSRPVDTVRFLLENGAEVNAATTDGFNQTPLHLAAEGQNVDVVRALLRKGASVNAKNSQSRTPLHLAAATGSYDVVRLLVEEGKVDVNARDSDGKTALGRAIDRGTHREIVEYLRKCVALAASSR